MRQLVYTLAVLLTASGPLLAQDKTYAAGGFFLMTTDEQAVILPCRPDMLISDIDKEIMNRDGMSIAEARETMRLEIAEIVAEQCRVFAKGDVLLPERKNLSAYQQLFRNSNYIERPLPVEDKTELRQEKVRQILQAGQPEEGTRVEQGQLQTFQGKKEKFMDLDLKADSMVNKVKSLTEYDYLICINELDVRVMRDPASDVGQAFDRKVKVHYSIFSPGGEKIKAGASSVIYPGSEKGIRPLLDIYFPQVGAQIAAEIARTDGEAEEEFLTPSAPEDSPEKKKKTSIKSLLNGSDDDF